MLIERPDMRFMVFESVLDLRTLKMNIDRAQVVERDLADLEDILGGIEDMMAFPPAEYIGSVLYDKDEAGAFERFNNHPIDLEKLGGNWDEVQEYLRSSEFQTMLNLACDCFDEMMSRDRGLPGFVDREQ